MGQRAKKERTIEKALRLKTQNLRKSLRMTSTRNSALRSIELGKLSRTQKNQRSRRDQKDLKNLGTLPTLVSNGARRTRTSTSCIRKGTSLSAMPTLRASVACLAAAQWSTNSSMG